MTIYHMTNYRTVDTVGYHLSSLHTHTESQTASEMCFVVTSGNIALASQEPRSHKNKQKQLEHKTVGLERE